MKENLIKIILILLLSMVLWRTNLSINHKMLDLEIGSLDRPIEKKSQDSIEDLIFNLDRVFSKENGVDYRLSLDARNVEVSGSSMDEEDFLLVLGELKEFKGLSINSLNIDSLDNKLNWTINILGDFNYKSDIDFTDYPRNKTPFYREKVKDESPKKEEESKDLGDEEAEDRKLTLELKAKNVEIEKPNRKEKIDKISEELSEEYIDFQNLEDYTRISYKNLKGNLDIDLKIESKDFDYMSFFLYSEEKSSAELKCGDRLLSKYNLEKGWNAIDYKGDGLPNRLVYKNKTDRGYILIDQVYTHRLDDLNG